ncbi:MAG: Fic family protein [Dysgonamonadaceae bacterium]|jgi:Fic family protein|nr:Fic family protein [Dysgonamonadaceae bacterium]
MNYKIPKLPLTIDLETKPVLRQLNAASRKLAELKGIARTIPNEIILINTLVLQEAKDSSAVENIVTTHDELFRADLDLKNFAITASTKEVLNYSAALKRGFELIRKDGLLTNTRMQEIQQILEGNRAGFRSVSGTTLKRNDGTIVYTPPQSRQEIEQYMANLELFINDNSISDIDPLIKMAIIHHQFESIHPFYDGNGRTGRIVNILYLVTQNLLDLPILYLSRFIIQNKSEYYTLLQSDRESNDWEKWVIFMLKGVEETSGNTIMLVKEISRLMLHFKHQIRPILGKSYRHDLLNNLFSHPYTKISFVQEILQVSRLTATQYLEKIVEAGLLQKIKSGRNNYYLNLPLCELFLNVSDAQSSDN